MVQINVSEWSRDVLKGLKKNKEHKNYDSTVRELFKEADVDEEKLINMIREEEWKEGEL